VAKIFAAPAASALLNNCQGAQRLAGTRWLLEQAVYVGRRETAVAT